MTASSTHWASGRPSRATRALNWLLTAGSILTLSGTLFASPLRTPAPILARASGVWCLGGMRSVLIIHRHPAADGLGGAFCSALCPVNPTDPNRLVSRLPCLPAVIPNLLLTTGTELSDCPDNIVRVHMRVSVVVAHDGLISPITVPVNPRLGIGLDFRCHDFAAALAGHLDCLLQSLSAPEFTVSVLVDVDHVFDARSRLRAHPHRQHQYRIPRKLPQAQDISFSGVHRAASFAPSTLLAPITTAGRPPNAARGALMGS